LSRLGKNPSSKTMQTCGGVREDPEGGAKSLTMEPASKEKGPGAGTGER